MESLDSFGEWLKKRRRLLDLTQEELASRAGCSVFALRKIESGERRPSKQLAGLLADALQVPAANKAEFIRVARGDLNLERLPAPGGAHPAALARQKPVPDPLPHLPTPLLGREPELAALERLFQDPQCRLLTLTGMGGIGKTRLAIGFAARQRGLFPGGLHYVPLAAVQSAESIVPAIAAAFAFTFSGPVDPQEQLCNHLASAVQQPALLVLDNLEHLIAGSAVTVELVAELLQRSPQLKILATSREQLQLPGEWRYEIHGLPLPPDELGGAPDEYSAVRLFVQCAQRIQAGYGDTAAEKAEAVRICRLLEGIPLAIELAAAWVGMLSGAEIAHEIEANIDFLTTTMRNIPERHRSLRASFDHSWRLLSGAEREALCRLAIFQGGFDRQAAGHIARASLPVLASLASKSLVRRTEDGRFDLHEVIRQYARSHLGANPAEYEQTGDAHCAHYLELAAGQAQALKSAAQPEAVRALAREMDNIRAAWAWGIERGRYAALAGAVRAVGWYHEVAGLLREGVDQLELLVCSLRGRVCDLQMGRALGAALTLQGLLHFRKGQFARALELYGESIAVLRTVGDRELLADALIFCGTLQHLGGEYREARAAIQEGLACAQAVGDRWFTAYGIYGLGHIDSLMGDYQRGYEQMLAGVQRIREVGDPQFISLALNFLVDTQIALARYEEAQASMRESIALCEQTHNRWGMGTAYRYLGLATLAAGGAAQAQGYFQKSLEIFSEQFEGWDIARTLTYLGDAALALGDLDGARSSYTQALRVAMEACSMPLQFDALAGLAELDARGSNPERALALTLLVRDHPAGAQCTKDRAGQIWLAAQSRLTAAQVQAVQEQAAHLSLEAAVRAVLAGEA